MSDVSGVMKLICTECQAKGPVLVGKRFSWRCPHRRRTVFESSDRRYLTYDEDTIRSPQRPAVIDNNGVGPFFHRALLGNILCQ